MKISKYFSFILCLKIITVCISSGIAQNVDKSWVAKYENPKSFIENRGQFPIVSSDKINKNDVLYAIDDGPAKIYFTKHGVIYNFIQAIEKKENKSEKEFEKKAGSSEAWKEREEKEHAKEFKSDEVSFIWENSNPDVEVVAEDMRTEYYSYSFKENKETKNINFIKGCNKIIYKNLYKNIDVEYTFHPTDGIKYSLILHPGADISNVKMTYSRNPEISKEGEVRISTKFGDIIDHTPVTFYSENSQLKVNSKFIKDGNSVKFELSNYDAAKTIVVDPWIQTPTLTNSNCVWECERDGAGNVYIIGGDVPLRLQKYNSAGTWQWTYSTPWDTTGGSNGDWLGTLATDLAGNNYVTNGSDAELEKINTSGGMVYHVNGGALDEYWNIAFNCDQTKLIIGGTRLTGILPSITGSGVIFDINTSNGSVNNFQKVGDICTFSVFGIPETDPNEVRSISSSRNARYYYLTLDSLGAIDQNVGACPNGNSLFKINSTYSFGYKCENYRPDNGNAGIMSIRANRNFVYTQNGTTIHKRSLATGAILSTATIPGGTSTTVPLTTPTCYQAGNSGIDIDSCGNVYVGSGNAIVKYDANLNFVSSVATPFHVYDVAVSTNGNVIICGATGDNSSTSRTGYVQSIASFTACDPMTLFCCDANICPVDTVCSSDPAFNLTATTPGGTWSGTGITNTTNGTFDPSVAGPGNHWVVYTLLCGSDSVMITVNLCATLFVCQELNGDVTVSGGSGPYTWEVYNPATSTPITNQTECTACGYTWFFGTCLDGVTPVTTCNTPGYWSTFATGTTVTPPGTWPIRVTDNFGNTVTINSLVSLPFCSTTCPVSAIASPSSICSGQNSNLTASGANTYVWNPGGLTGTTVTVSPTTTTTYTVTGTAGTCTATATVTVTVTTTPIVSASATPSTICSGGSSDLTGSGATTYSWNPGGLSGTTVTVSPTTTATYTVTGTTGSCTGTATVTVTVSSSLSVSASATPSTICTGGSADLTGSGATTYSWNPGGLSGTTVTVSPTTTTTYTITGTSGACTGTAIVTVTVNSSIIVSATAAPPTVCSGSSTTLTGSGATTYTWNPGGLSGTTVNVSPTTTTTYSVTGTSGGCSGTGTVVVTINPLPNVATSSTSALCYLNNGSATAIPSGGTSPYTYSWNTSPVQTSVTAINIPSGNYIVTVTDANGCSKTASVFVPSTGGPTASITPTSATLILGDSITLNASGGGSYLWTPSTGISCDTCQNIIVSPITNTIYCVIVADSNLCTDTACVTIDIDVLCGDVFVPTAFSPNDDGKNDVLYVRGKCITTMTFAIYDRWGEKVFESKDPLMGWDGKFHKKPCNTGVFVWYLNATLHDGTEVSKKGNLTLFR